MEKKDLDLIEKYISTDEELRKHVEAHKKYEDMLEEYKKRIFLTPEEEMEQKRIKKLKLKGRDEISRILEKYKKES